MYVSHIDTNSANLAGILGLSLPYGLNSNDLPIGLQLLAAPFEEETLLRAARIFDQATERHTKRTPK